ncbi:zinc finger protein 880-like [Drosophila innubila]|uniref:zinc finger protein 880-like n=1 Tax=Drosophila innubila TaxID=198719 RepID=UPI00148B3E48|nr:zinc finger protein 880-like [Drosophila innubila]
MSVTVTADLVLCEWQLILSAELVLDALYAALVVRKSLLHKIKSKMKETMGSRSAYRKRLLRFEKKEKIRLIAAVRVRRLLWDMLDSEHNDMMGVKEAWQSVGSEIGRDPNDCKVAWRSLRQSYRYHCKAANSRLKIGEDDDEGEVDPLETRDIQWVFADHMAFLKEMSKEKRSDSVALDETPTSNSVLEDYTDMEYLETYDHNHDEVEGDDVNYPTQDDVDEEGTTNIYYLTKSSTHEDMLSKPKITQNDVLCRTCMQPTDARTSENLFKPHNSKLLRDIKELTDLHLKRDEDYSDFICGHCQQVLEIASEFRRVCIESQTQVLINVQMKEETEDMDSPESIIQHSSSHSDLSIQEERLEDIAISDNEIYYEEDDVPPLASTKSPPIIKKSKKQSKSFKYQCHECGLTFSSQDLLKMHMHQIHSMQLHTRFVCKHCGHDFKYSAPLVEHLKSIGVKFDYKCEECGQKFHSRFFLKKHMRRVHGLADEHICHICGKNFTTGFNLRNHIVRHAGTRPHKCKLCNAAFSTTAELNNHKRTHDNVRPYPCRYGCGKTFRHCSNRSTHERVHMDGSLRPFQCDYCDKSFVTKGDCRTHQVVHTMSRDFSCDICEQSFKLQKHYQQHLTTKSHKKVEALAKVQNTDTMA